MRAKVENAGFQPTGSTPEAFRELIASDTQKWGKAVAATGFKAD
jgi:tripartite-type tricarboxylate transporter receptor subunit TctC